MRLKNLKIKKQKYKKFQISLKLSLISIFQKQNIKCNLFIIRLLNMINKSFENLKEHDKNDQKDIFS